MLLRYWLTREMAGAQNQEAGVSLILKKKKKEGHPDSLDFRLLVS